MTISSVVVVVVVSTVVVVAAVPSVVVVVAISSVVVPRGVDVGVWEESVGESPTVNPKRIIDIRNVFI